MQIGTQESFLWKSAKVGISLAHQGAASSISREKQERHHDELPQIGPDEMETPRQDTLRKLQILTDMGGKYQENKDTLDHSRLFHAKSGRSIRRPTQPDSPKRKQCDQNIEKYHVVLL